MERARGVCLTLFIDGHVQVLETEQAKEMARKEKARLKLLEQQRKEQVEKMHAKLNSDAAAGEVCVSCVSKPWSID